jgi:RNA polymerase sigma-70 factor, ECF subfamily
MEFAALLTPFRPFTRPPRAGILVRMPRDEAARDEELMLAYRDGNTAAFDQLYRRHKGPLYRYLLRQCRDAAAAEELFQDIWMNLVRARASYAVTARFSTYLYRLAHNRLIDHYRRRVPAALVSFDDDDTALEVPAGREGEPPVAHERKAQAAHVLQALEALPAAQREAFVLQHEAGLTLEEIAEATGVGRETVKSRLRYAIAKLREELKEWL